METDRLGIDWRGAALGLRQGASLLRALGSGALSAAIKPGGGVRRRGREAVAGLEGEVEILRDRWGVPHCYAQSTGDALFGLGYVHAQDRLWQMEWNRRAALGRVSEIAGPGGLPADRLTRTIGFGRSADRAWAATTQGERERVSPYVAGINAAMSRAPRPLEAQMLEDRIYPWQATDSIAWSKLLSFLLAPAWEQQVMRARVLERAGVETLEALDPPTARDLPVSAPPEAAWGELSRPLREGARALSELLGVSQGASNNWALDGRHTASGAAMLACDPHLNPVAPPHAYFAHLSCPEFNAAGATVPGLPGIVWGYNDHVAWGPTAAMLAMHVAVVEELSADGEQVRRPQGWAPLRRVTERIPVRGYPTERLIVREAPSGPLVSEIAPRGSESVAGGQAPGRGRRALGLHSTVLAATQTGGASIDLMSARDWESWSAAAAEMRDFNLCFAFADRTGRVGLRTVGDVPSGDPTALKFPVAGWAPPDQGGVPQQCVRGDQLPHVYDPRGGMVASANNPLGPAELRVGAEYLGSARVERIRELLEAGLASEGGQTREDSAQMQLDLVSTPMRAFARRLAAAVSSPQDRESLAAWDGAMEASSTLAARVAAAFVAYRWAALTEALGAEAAELLGPQWAIPTLDIFAARAPASVLARIDADPEAAQSELAAAWERGRERLQKRFGGDASSWTWGRCRQLTLRHGLADAPLVGGWLSGGPFAVGGDADTLAQSGVLGSTPFAAASAMPALRLIVEMSDPPEAEFALAGEQAAEALRPVGPLTESWLRATAESGRFPLLRDREAVEAAGGSRRRLRLTPYRPEAGHR